MLADIFISAMAGGGFVVFGEWWGRMVFFPYKFPGGFVWTFFGGTKFFYLLIKNRGK
ncbi:iron chelate uptake ABC transporter family permease subunit [Enterobacter intestinihominis]